MTCDNCGMPAQDRLCRDCELVQANEKLHGTVEEATEWEVEQRGLDGEAAHGQTTLDGGLVAGGESDE